MLHYAFNNGITFFIIISKKDVVSCCTLHKENLFTIVQHKYQRTNVY